MQKTVFKSIRIGFDGFAVCKIIIVMFKCLDSMYLTLVYQKHR